MCVSVYVCTYAQSGCSWLLRVAFSLLPTYIHTYREEQGFAYRKESSLTKQLQQAELLERSVEEEKQRRLVLLQQQQQQQQQVVVSSDHHQEEEVGAERRRSRSISRSSSFSEYIRVEVRPIVGLNDDEVAQQQGRSSSSSWNGPMLYVIRLSMANGFSWQGKKVGRVGR